MKGVQVGVRTEWILVLLEGNLEPHLVYSQLAAPIYITVIKRIANQINAIYNRIGDEEIGEARVERGVSGGAAGRCD